MLSGTVCLLQKWHFYVPTSYLSKRQVHPRIRTLAIFTKDKKDLIYKQWPKACSKGSYFCVGIFPSINFSLFFSHILAGLMEEQDLSKQAWTKVRRSLRVMRVHGNLSPEHPNQKCPTPLLFFICSAKNILCAEHLIDCIFCCSLF